jgi:hypothetical protein
MSIGRRFFPSTSTMVTTELHIWLFSLRFTSHSFVLRWKYCKRKITTLISIRMLLSTAINGNETYELEYVCLSTNVQILWHGKDRGNFLGFFTTKNKFLKYNFEMFHFIKKQTVKRTVVQCKRKFPTHTYSEVLYNYNDLQGPSEGAATWPGPQVQRGAQRMSKFQKILMIRSTSSKGHILWTWITSWRNCFKKYSKFDSLRCFLISQMYCIFWSVCLHQ